MPQNLKSLVTQSLYPKITTVTSGSATAVLPAGGETVTVSGSGFQTGATIWINNSNVATTFTSSTTLTFTSPAQSAGFYQLFVYNTDGSVATKPGGLIYNAAPVWSTASGALTSGSPGLAYTTTVVATGGTITYSVISGSLPTGLGLNSSTGEISGTPTSDNTYNFTIAATNQYNQSTSRSFSIEIANKPSTVEYLVVAGGGSGGNAHGGGGGAGGLRTGTGLSVTPGVTYTITVGGGAAGKSTRGRGNNGSNSVFSTITATGGGGGGSQEGAISGASGGSGGGGAQTTGGATAGGAGNTPPTTPSQGNNGGPPTTSSAPWYGSGGGGASAVGGNSSTAGAGAGGAGATSAFSGASVTYAGGGGGCGESSGTGGAGGAGGGTAGTGGSDSSLSAAANTGGGSGGTRDGIGSGVPSGAGGSGIVIVRYSDSFVAATSTTGSPTITVSGGYRIYTFTGSGSITF